MPPAMKRTKYVTDARKASWNPAPAEELWDVQRLAAYLKSAPVHPLFALFSLPAAYSSRMCPALKLEPACCVAEIE